MKENLTLFSRDLTVELRTIIESDCENLRQWKNANRFAFFYQDIITPAQQIEWFKSYLNRTNDYMFIVSSYSQIVGSMGFRVLDHQADIYNVILANIDMGQKGLMSQAMRLMCSYILADFSQDVGVQVLRSNPATQWYRKNGFKDLTVRETFVEMKLDLAEFQPCIFQRIK